MTKPNSEKSESYRKLIEDLWPELYVLREAGYSWRQLTQFFGKFKINLEPARLCDLYQDIMITKMDQAVSKTKILTKKYEQLYILNEMPMNAGKYPYH